MLTHVLLHECRYIGPSGPSNGLMARISLDNFSADGVTVLDTRAACGWPCPDLKRGRAGFIAGRYAYWAPETTPPQ